MIQRSENGVSKGSQKSTEKNFRRQGTLSQRRTTFENEITKNFKPQTREFVSNERAKRFISFQRIKSNLIESNQSFIHSFIHHQIIESHRANTSIISFFLFLFVSCIYIRMPKKKKRSERKGGGEWTRMRMGMTGREKDGMKKR